VIYVEAPKYEEWPSVFLAGGITGCPDWQKQVVEFLKPIPIVVYNPRREDFPIGDPEAANEQIEWEYHFLKKVSFRFFWFPKETICPIVLYELGKYANGNPVGNFVVGTHRDYQRRQDVVIQTGLAHPGKDIHFDLANTVYDLVIEMDRQWGILRERKLHDYMSFDMYAKYFEEELNERNLSS
jgi:hypothetical protein